MSESNLQRGQLVLKSDFSFPDFQYNHKILKQIICVPNWGSKQNDVCLEQHLALFQTRNPGEMVWLEVF